MSASFDKDAGFFGGRGESLLIVNVLPPRRPERNGTDEIMGIEYGRSLGGIGETKKIKYHFGQAVMKQTLPRVGPKREREREREREKLVEPPHMSNSYGVFLSMSF